MKQRFFLFILLLATTLSATEVDRLLNEYQQIETVSCQIRRIKEGAAGKIRFLSRVYYTNKDQLHAEGITPIKRHTIADGTSLYQYFEGSPKGFCRPVTALSEQMKISLRMVPCTAMDHLLRLKGLEEKMLPANDTAVKRIGIQTENYYVVLAFDTMDRLTGIIFYKTSDMQKQTAKYTYGNFHEAIPGVWIPFLHEAMLTMADGKFKETVRVDRFVENQPIARSLFIPSNFFNKDIDFVDEFSKIDMHSERER